MEPRDRRDRDEATRDAALLSRVAAGDRAAFRSMYERYFDRLFRFVHRIVDHFDQVEEIVNDTMYVVWSKADTFAGRSRVSTWLFGIAYRKSLKALEKQRRIKEDLINPSFRAERNGDPYKSAQRVERPKGGPQDERSA